jgi:uncharacterized protein YpmB
MENVCSNNIRHDVILPITIIIIIVIIMEAASFIMEGTRKPYHYKGSEFNLDTLSNLP